MKNKLIAIIVIVAVVCISWFAVLSGSSSQVNRVTELKKQIDANIKVKTYKNTIPMYEELISIEPETIDWYFGLADTYLAMEWYGDYIDQLQRVVSVFPESRTGYIRLIKYYDEYGKDSDVITIYNTAPDSIKADEEFFAIYKSKEWSYNFLSSSYDHVGSCSGGFYTVGLNGLYGYVAKDFSGSIDLGFTVARPFIEDYAAVNKDNEWYFIDVAGDRVLATNDKLEDLYSLSEGFAVAKMGGKYGFIDSSFKQYVFEYEDATSLYNGVAAVKKNGKWGLINSKFEAITSFEYDDVKRNDANICSSNGVIFMLKDKEYQMIGIDGKKITSETFNDVNLFYSDYAAVKKGKKWGFIDTKGNTVIDFKYDGAYSYASGMATVKQGEYWGCVDMNGNEILEFDFAEAMITSSNGVATVKIGDLYRFIKFIKFE